LFTKDVEVAEGLDGGLDHAAAAVPVRHVLVVGHRTPAGGGDLRHDLLGSGAAVAAAGASVVGRATPVVHDDCRALAANRSACSRPMPLPAPVMTATRPSSAPMCASAVLAIGAT
jgi:hypothetical protein